MEYREVAPSAYSWRGSKCARCRVGHGLRYNRAEVCGARAGTLTRSYGSRPVFGRLMVFVGERVDEFVELFDGEYQATVKNLGRGNPTSFAAIDRISTEKFRGTLRLQRVRGPALELAGRCEQ